MWQMPGCFLRATSNITVIPAATLQAPNHSMCTASHFILALISTRHVRSYRSGFYHRTSEPEAWLKERARGREEYGEAGRRTAGRRMGLLSVSFCRPCNLCLTVSQHAWLCPLALPAVGGASSAAVVTVCSGDGVVGQTRREAPVPGQSACISQQFLQR